MCLYTFICIYIYIYIDICDIICVYVYRRGGSYFNQVTLEIVPPTAGEEVFFRPTYPLDMQGHGEGIVVYF